MHGVWALVAAVWVNICFVSHPEWERWGETESERDRSGCVTDGPCQRSKRFLLSAATPSRAFIWEPTKAAWPRSVDVSASERNISAHGAHVNKDHLIKATVYVNVVKITAIFINDMWICCYWYKHQPGHGLAEALLWKGKSFKNSSYGYISDLHKVIIAVCVAA